MWSVTGDPIRIYEGVAFYRIMTIVTAADAVTGMNGGDETMVVF